MHSSAPHRARVIAAPATHTDPAPEMPAAQLSRQAALFQRLREGVRAGASETPGGEQPCAAPAEPPFGEQADPRYPVAGFAADEHRDDAGSGERDDDAPAGSGDERDDAAAHARSAAPIHPPMHSTMRLPGHSAMHGFMHVPAYSTMPAPMPMPMPARRAAPLSPQRPPNAPPPTAAPDMPHMPRVHAAREPQRPTAGGPHVVAAVRAPARTGQDMNRFVDSIVAEVSDFCANPIVFESGDWQITIPIDPALLPGCTLSLALSHFQLTLRFDTTDARSRELISQHAATLRTSLEEVMQNRFDGARSVEIIVT
ncbi:type III secretion system protein SctP [Burkholderia sp. BCCIQ04A]|uniref:Type III secretion system protein SctP n=1 Tax=Burkholderia anthinoferrum TaxID=3090833 RepID=A0ABU5WMX1_9BURK|nr:MULTISPECIES: type III secretion system protein SctP [Burkholderia]MEB2504149.1 type III secretion system protein SctP [Burkholderia anthinoferrum]MEB2530362.1 type III secretion system protein SctP [Burkholderia anthinoferrum]MEB2562904.1 type III secretion system protein SctP [Burkholderia anthinoferrum]MEB2580307.1 type III secretion system protein SctP [Burkholderia anthinoferrum]MDF3099610.1 type III secretion system protein SctP [Burkholderia semiarida]